MTADERIARLEKWLGELYSTAEKNMRVKWQAYLYEHQKTVDKLLEKIRDAKDDELKKKATKAYNEYMKDHVTTTKYYRGMVSEMARQYADAGRRAAEIVNGDRFGAFADGYNFSAGEINRAAIAQDIGIRFDLCDAGTIEHLAEHAEDLLLPPKADPSKVDLTVWNVHNINSQVTQGIVQGESIPKIAARLGNVTHMNEVAAVRTARTMTTAAENAGRVQSMKTAEGWGVKTRKKWMCTHDSRTRHSHLLLDGETVDDDAEFSNKCRYPGDPNGPAEEVYNCRCTLITVIDGFSSNLPAGKENAIHVWIDGEEVTGDGGSAPAAPAAEAGPWDRVRELRSAKPAAEMSSAELKEIGRAFYDSEEYKTTAGETQKRVQDKIRELQHEYDSIRAESNAIDIDALKTKEERGAAADRLDELNARRRIVFRELKNLKENADYKAEISRLISEVRNENLGSLTEQEYKAHFGRKTEVRDVVADAYGRYPSSWVQASIDKSALHVKKVGRGHYNDHLNELVISGDGDDARNTAVHEIGHRMEDTIRGILNAEKQFYEERTNGEKAEWLGYGYARNERTRRDDFVSAYMGKDYGGTAYELVSMGFEGVIGFTNRVDLSKDEDMRDWVTGILLAY